MIYSWIIQAKGFNFLPGTLQTHINMTLVEDYLNSLVLFVEATEKNDPRAAKKYYKIMDSLFRKLRDSGLLVELVKFLNHENDEVRLWVSTHLLVYNESIAKKSLEKIANSELGLTAFSAEMTLQEWNKGNLTYLVE